MLVLIVILACSLSQIPIKVKHIRVI